MDDTIDMQSKITPYLLICKKKLFNVGIKDNYTSYEYCTDLKRVQHEVSINKKYIDRKFVMNSALNLLVEKLVEKIQLVQSQIQESSIFIYAYEIFDRIEFKTLIIFR